MKVYLINKQDRYCPENNNGDYIVAVFLDKDLAEKWAREADEMNPCDAHYVNERETDDNKQELCSVCEEANRKGDSVYCSTKCQDIDMEDFEKKLHDSEKCL